ncbi:PhoX family phosphatase [Nocardioides panacisoli]|uniref:PhoX family protein n=1 Tax=Nocardioides panacisoli TaxID=627624 RepID=UPI001C624AB3|nr:PhoX family phosphatase [Nocardioides panacisoli]QYJ04633.1 PhoX family phosphatase [Nocardioides panacisoli]
MSLGPGTPLPLVPVDRSGVRHGSRSYLTCAFRCGNACDHPEPNRSGNPHIADEIARAVGRRSVLRGAAVGGGALVLGVGGSGSLAAAATSPSRNGRGHGHGRGDSLANADFEPVAPNTRDDVVVPRGYESDVVMRWGDPVVAGAPRFDPYRQSVAAAEKQFGFNCDYVGVLPLPGRSAVLVVNHEYTSPTAMFPAGVYEDAERIAIEMANHGMSVVTLEEHRGSWRAERGRRAWRNRRIHDRTEFRLDGPAAGDPRLRTSADRTGRRVLGTFNNCAGGTTPWGTVLSGEENFNQYFGSSGDLDARYADEYARYGISGGTARGWQDVDERFDLTAEPHEPHRFGWVVEVDPYDPSSTPVKHTMLGRFKHEGANVTLSRDGRAVAYMGDDERGDYLYRFVSQERFAGGRGRKARRHNQQLLSKGTLYVARLTGDGTDDDEYDGTGRWIPLCSDRRSFVEGMSVADVLIFTRLAADKVTPTRMDRPEDVEPNPVNGRVYAALTNNSQRGSTFPPDEANPITSSQVRANPAAPLTTASGNRNGYVLELAPRRGDHTDDRFTWELFLVCGDPEAPETHFGGVDKDRVSPISCPDNVAFDSTGNLWVSTDGNALGGNDGVFRVPVDGPDRGRVECFLTVPKGAEACGPLITDRDRNLWVAVQHPGEVDGSSFDSPASTWPHTDDFPRPSVVVNHRR